MISKMVCAGLGLGVSDPAGSLLNGEKFAFFNFVLRDIPRIMENNFEGILIGAAKGFCLRLEAALMKWNPSFYDDTV